ncbi:MAG: ATP-dependent sacrificial sulfur transferase LarE [Candidatus Helarchaeota archaeon]
MDQFLKKKVENVYEIIEGKKVLVAFSGGVDSSTILSLAKEVAEKILAVTVKSRLMTDEELINAKEVATELGVEWRIIELDILADEKFVQNPPDRCYFCKKNIMSELLKIANEENLDMIIDGTNTEDLKDLRPGHMALLELNIRSPLAEAGIKKNEVREIAKFRNLSVWKRPSLACLASRIPYGEEITKEKLEKIAKAENYVRYKAKVKVVRVRCYDDLVRIEIGKHEMKNIFSEEVIEKIVSFLKGLGFKYITLDLEGYRSGSMDEVLENKGSD